MEWIERRNGYPYPGCLFSQDGSIIRKNGREYREVAFSSSAQKRFRIWLASVLLLTFPGIPLISYWGLQGLLLWIGIPILALEYWLYKRIHACPGCGNTCRELTIGRMGAPVLHLCDRCDTFFEHGEIDGGLPWK